MNSIKIKSVAIIIFSLLVIIFGIWGLTSNFKYGESDFLGIGGSIASILGLIVTIFVKPKNKKSKVSNFSITIEKNVIKSTKIKGVNGSVKIGDNVK